MKGRMNKRSIPIRRTPKVFNSNFQPARRFDWSQYRSLRPLFWVIGVLLAIFLIGRLPAFRVETIETIGDSSAQAAAALNDLKGQSLLSHSLTNNIDKIELSLPFINTLDCRRGIPGTLKCSVGLRKPSLVWKTGTDQFLVDQSGFVYATAPTSLPSGVAVVEDRSALPVKLGQVIASSQIISNFTTLAQLLNSSRLQFNELFVVDTLYQAGAQLTGSSDPNLPFANRTPISVLFTFENPLQGQVDTLVEVLKEKHDQITDHVDLRVPGYAYIQ